METNATEQWIYAQAMTDTLLTALVGDRIENTTRTKPLPCVLFQLQLPGSDFTMLGGYRLWTPNVYLIRGIVEFLDDAVPSYEGMLAQIANRIDVLFHAPPPSSNEAGNIYSSERIRPFQMSENANGRTWRHLGGLYRIRAR